MPMRAFLIDPFTKTVQTLHNDQDWPNEAVCRAIGTDSISRASISPGQVRDWIWVDDTGFRSAGVPVFFIGEYAMPLAGKALILGTDSFGGTRGPELSLADLTALVQWTNLESTGELTPMFEAQKGIHLGLPICKPHRDFVPTSPALASFSFELWGQIIRLEDNGNHELCPTVTKDAQNVFAVLSEAVGPRMAWTPVIFKDNERQWDAMIPNDKGAFHSFLVLRGSTFEEARARLDAMFGQ